MNNGPLSKQNNRYYEGLNWWGECNNPLLRSYITRSCYVLVTPDKNALTSKGKVILEGILCPRGPSVVTTLELLERYLRSLRMISVLDVVGTSWNTFWFLNEISSYRLLFDSFLSS
jgi:hypothetical protein